MMIAKFSSTKTFLIGIVLKPIFLLSPGAPLVAAEAGRLRTARTTVGPMLHLNSSLEHRRWQMVEGYSLKAFRYSRYQKWATQAGLFSGLAVGGVCVSKQTSRCLAGLAGVLAVSSAFSSHFGTKMNAARASEYSLRAGWGPERLNALQSTMNFALVPTPKGGILASWMMTF